MVKEKTHASSKDFIASFIASEPDINVPYGNLLEPNKCLSSETFSASSLSSKISKPHYNSRATGNLRTAAEKTYATYVQ